MPEEELAAAAVKLEALISDGEAALNAGNRDAAMAVAMNAVATNPNSARALALKSMCHERAGEVADALECAERVVELNPDSELDKIRRNQLRSALLNAARHQEPDRKLAALGAAAAAILVICGGAFAATLVNRSQERTLVASNEPVQQSLQQQVQGPAEPGANTKTPTESESRVPPQQEAPPTGGASEVGAIRQETSRSNSGRELPLPPFNGAFQGVIPPVKVEVDGSLPTVGNSTSKPPQQQPNSRRDPDPSPDDDRNFVAEQQPEVDKGEYTIRVHNPNAKLAGGSVDVSNSQGVEALVRTGTQQYQVGNYGGAANTLEKALSSGADPVTTNQRLGQAYERAGRTSDAINAYNRAIQAAEAALAGGKGNRSKLEAARDSCRQALKVLQGT